MSGWLAGFGIGVGCWLGFNAAIVGACLLRGPRELPSPPDLDRLDEDPWLEFDRVTAEKGTCW